jgi:hypothetical protein
MFNLATQPRACAAFACSASPRVLPPRAACGVRRPRAAAPHALAARTRCRATFNANDPATWGAKSDEEEEQTAFASEDVQLLSDAQLSALLSQSSAPTPPAAAAAPTKERAPEDAAGAIAAGLRAFAAGDAAGALVLFAGALTLPGSGLRRTKGAARELSQGERQAALYNAACCHARLGEAAAGVDALLACCAAGFDDFATLRRDADLAPLRSAPEWRAFAASFEAQASSTPQGLLGRLFGR